MISINAVTDEGADQIQDQIINITAAQEGEQLGDLHKGNGQSGNQQNSPQTAALGENLRQQQSQGNEHDHIAVEIDEGGGSVIGIVQGVQEKLHGVHGLQIEIPADLVPVGDTLCTALAVEQQVQHDGAVEPEQDDIQFPAGDFHAETSFGISAHYSRCKPKKQEKEPAPFGAGSM